MHYICEYESPVGTLTLASDGEAICGLWLEGQKYHGATLDDDIEERDDAGGFPELRSWLDRYFAGEAPATDSVPIAPKGSDFRQAVWKKLQEIPYGELTTYGEIAEELKAERGRASALAVGGAVGHNPISILVPCHRVVGADGSLTGYAGGLMKKIHLLELEGVAVDTLYIPTKGTAL